MQLGDGSATTGPMVIRIAARPRVSLKLLGLIIALALTADTCGAQDLEALEDALIKIVEKTEPAVVSIARFRKPPEEGYLALPNPEKPPLQQERNRFSTELDLLPNEFGAGFLIGPTNNTDRLVLTNYHVVRGGPVYPNFKTDDGTELRIRLSDRRGCLGAIIAADPRSDLAVLRLQWQDTGVRQTDYPRLNWDSAPAPRKGQLVILFGNPHAIARDGSPSVSWGIVSNLTRQPAVLQRGDLSRQEENVNRSMMYRLGLVMQLDARLNLGTSGGPVLNLKGELVGISTSLAAIEGYEQSAGFAIPIDKLTRRVIKTLLAGQEVEYGMIGISPEDMMPDDFLTLNSGLPQRSAARVKEVRAGSPAAVAGILPRDVIVAVDGEPVRSMADLMRMVGLHPPESEITLAVFRAAQFDMRKPDEVKVKLAKWPVLDDEGIIETSPRFAPWRGLTVDYPTARDKLLNHPGFGRTPFPADFHCVLVKGVAEKSPAYEAGLESGNYITHVNKTPVQTPAEFHAAVNKATGVVTLRLSDDSHSFSSRQGRTVQVHE